MALFKNCCFAGKKKKVKKGSRKLILDAKDINAGRSLEVKPEHPVKSSENVELNSTSFDASMPFCNISGNSNCKVNAINPEDCIDREPKKSNTSYFSSSAPHNIPENSSHKVKIIDPENPIEREPQEVAYESENECKSKSPSRSDNSQSNLQTCDINSGKRCIQVGTTEMDLNEPSSSEVVNRHSVEEINYVEGIIVIQHAHISDRGMDGEEQCSSQELQRSCSSLETREVLKKIAYELPPSKSQSLEELQELTKEVKENIGSPCSQSSTLSHYSADKVTLKKHSYSQILPSRSRKIWWKLFLWSHRNLKRTNSTKPKVSQLASANQQGGYSSDTLEPDQVKELSKLESPNSSSGRGSHKSDHEDNDPQICDGLKIRVLGYWPQNQWAAFSGETSPLKRVDDWVNDHLEVQSTSSSDEGDNDVKEIIFPPSPKVTGSMANGTMHRPSYSKVNLSQELLHANTVIQTLNSSSTVAHISGMGLRIVPTISQFSSLRSVNLSNNSIVQITPGSLPKGLQSLDLSRNKICTIEGLRELTRLRVLDLSYNRISRLGHGVANCRLLKELYLAGNKISEVEGLHRLHKLTVLDLSFNKITSKKAMGQIVANYSSLIALNLLGNLIQKNLSEVQLRKAICGLLPKLAYLNKQAVNQQKAREVSKDIVAKTTSRSSSWSVRRRLSKKVSQNGARLTSSRSSLGIVEKSRTNLKSRTNKQSGLSIST